MEILNENENDKFLNGINGLSIEEIERRAKPIKDNKRFFFFY